MSGAFPLSSSASAGIKLQGSFSLEAKAADAQDIKEAAQKFEAIFIRQMLAAARSTDFGGEKLLDGPGLKQFTTMQDENFADIMTKNGGLGFAKMIEAQLSARLNQDSHNQAGQNQSENAINSANRSKPLAAPYPLNSANEG